MMSDLCDPSQVPIFLSVHHIVWYFPFLFLDILDPRAQPHAQASIHSHHGGTATGRFARIALGLLQRRRRLLLLFGRLAVEEQRLAPALLRRYPPRRRPVRSERRRLRRRLRRLLFRRRRLLGGLLRRSYRPCRRVSRPALWACAFEAETEAWPDLESNELAHDLSLLGTHLRAHSAARRRIRRRRRRRRVGRPRPQEGCGGGDHEVKERLPRTVPDRKVEGLWLVPRTRRSLVLVLVLVLVVLAGRLARGCLALVRDGLGIGLGQGGGSLHRTRVSVRAGSKVVTHLRRRLSPSLLLEPLNVPEHSAPFALLELALL